MNEVGLNIAAVERDTGLSKAVLRMWERRYGFPLPVRDRQGDRRYSPELVENLRHAKRLIDCGHRPGTLFSTPTDRWPTSFASSAGRKSASLSQSSHESLAEVENLLSLILAHELDALEGALVRQMLVQGVKGFVLGTLAPLIGRVGEAWHEGRLSVFEEHGFTELVQRFLREAVSRMVVGSAGPRILFLTAPNEQHGLGLLMAEVLFSASGARCVSLGTELPLIELHRAALAHRADVVALSFSAFYPIRQLPATLRRVRESLEPETELWVGGDGVSRLPLIKDIRCLTLEEGIVAVESWLPSGTAS
jgi:methanogenic corrinoid protein MtbC1